MGAKHIKNLLRKDDSYKKFKQISEYCESLAEFDNLVKEMENMHSARKSRNLYLKTPKIDKLIEASTQGSSFRSRYVEIMLSVMKAQRTLEAAIKRIEYHILVNYKEQFGARSQADKKAIVSDILQKDFYKLADYNRIIEMAQASINDIDQSQWAIKHSLDALNILYTRESILGKQP